MNESERRERSHIISVIQTVLFKVAGFVIPLLFLAFTQAVGSNSIHAQSSFPAPPSDHSLIYLGIEPNTLEPLPFETGTTPLRTDAVAGNDKTSYIEVKGLSAVKAISNSLPRFYLFVPDEANVHPPFIVRLTQKGGARRVTAMAQKGLKGFAIYSEEIVKPRYRVLSRSDGVLYMEISPREPLSPGEYGIVGSDLQRIATLRISIASNQ